MGIIDNDVRQLNRDPGLDHDADDDSEASGDPADGQRPLRAELENLYPTPHRQPHPLRGEARQDDRGNSVEHRRVGTAPGNQQTDDDQDRNEKGPIRFDYIPRVAELRTGQTHDPVSPCIGVGDHQQGGDKQERGNNRNLDDVQIGNPGEVGHDENRRAHQRRHGDAYGRGGGLECGGDVRRKAGPFHQWDGQGAGADHVGRRGTRNHAEQGAGDDRDLCRAATQPPQEHQGQVDKQVAAPGLLERRSQNHEQEDEAGKDSGDGAVNSLVAVEPAENVRKRQPGMPEDARKVRAEKRIEEKRHAKARQKASDDPAPGLQHGNDQDRPGDDVVGLGLAPPLHEAYGEPERVVNGDRDGGDDKTDVDGRNAPPRGLLRRPEGKKNKY